MFLCADGVLAYGFRLRGAYQNARGAFRLMGDARESLRCLRHRQPRSLKAGWRRERGWRCVCGKSCELLLTVKKAALYGIARAAYSGVVQKWGAVSKEWVKAA